MAGDDADELRWHVHGERPLYENRWVRLTLVDVEPPAGGRFEHQVVRLQRVALAVVLDGDDRVLMMWRHRFATDERGWELPGGIVEPNEDGESTARREVEEEAGWRPGPLTHLVSFQPMPGMVDTPTRCISGAVRSASGIRPTPRKPRGSNGCRSIRCSTWSRTDRYSDRARSSACSTCWHPGANNDQAAKASVSIRRR